MPAFSVSGAARPASASDPSPDTANRDSRSASVQNEQGLSKEELSRLSELKARDREVRAHEAAHQAAGGQHAGAVSFTFERGPDGAEYAVGGEVSIDVSPVQGDPQATIEKMRIVRAAAMAPAEPSSQDRAVAAEAMQVMLQARTELASERNGDSGDALSQMGAQASSAYRSVSALADEPPKPTTGFGPVAA
ncbi:hypothetical protein KXD86_05405 [Marinobacter sp. CAU 1620]|nr:hypothetical protein [Marinobacter arenosus]